MDTLIWINLPVKDLAAAREFYTQAGFLLPLEGPDDENIAGFRTEKQNVQVMLFPEETFKGFIRHEVADPALGSEVVFSLSASSKEEVDNMIYRIEQAGGTIFAEPGEQNGMYGAGFCDVDGHRWNFLVM